MYMGIKQSLKDIPFIYNTYRTARKLIVDRPLSQKQILQSVLRYNKKRFVHYSGAYNNSKGKDTAYITWLYHVIEKGLAMRDMRPGFGQEKIKELCKLTQDYGRKYGCGGVTYQSSVAVIKEYIRVNKKLNVRFDGEISDYLEVFESVDSQISLGGGTRKRSFMHSRVQNFHCSRIVGIL